LKPKKCKVCKEKFTPMRPLQMVCSYQCGGKLAKLKREKKKEKELKEWNKERKRREPDVRPQKYKGLLNTEIQKLSRLIDKKCGVAECIDCGRPLPKKYDSGHFHSKGSNPSIAWNLHNMHSQRSECNMPEIGGGRRLEYYEGLAKKYGQEYADYVRYDIVRLYPTIHVSNQEVAEKVTLVRKINREIDTYKFSDPIKARTMFNKIIGIYDRG